MRVHRDRVIAVLAMAVAALKGPVLLVSGGPLALASLVLFGGRGVMMLAK